MYTICSVTPIDYFSNVYPGSVLNPNGIPIPSDPSPTVMLVEDDRIDVVVAAVVPTNIYSSRSIPRWIVADATVENREWERDERSIKFDEMGP